jgi:hypothetical protein
MKLSSTLCPCGGRASFNYENLPPKYCSKCKSPEMKCLNLTKCKADNCILTATYGYQNDKILYYKNHKLN